MTTLERESLRRRYASCASFRYLFTNFSPGFCYARCGKSGSIANQTRSSWALAFLPDNQGILITLKGGQLRHWQAGKGLSDPLPGVPQVWANGQGGLLDVALAPDFTTSRRVWLSFAEGDANGKAGTAVGYGRLSEDLSHLSDFKTVFRQTPKLSTGNHFGGRLVFDGKGYLFIGLGENNQRPTAQDLDKLQGKVVRLTDQGQIPPDNPFVNQAAVRPEIWSYGIRNPQGMAMNPWSDACG